MEKSYYHLDKPKIRDEDYLRNKGENMSWHTPLVHQGDNKHLFEK